MIYSHSYEDPETGELIDVMLDEGSDHYRNAGPRERRADRRRSPGRPRPRPYSGHPHDSGRRLQPRGRALVVREPRPTRQPMMAPPPGMSPQSGEYFAIKKSTLAELAPAVGQICASFLGRPEAPRAVGDAVIDRDNAAMHRDALAAHQQNQTRILALSDLAARAAKLFL